MTKDIFLQLSRIEMSTFAVWGTYIHSMYSISILQYSSNKYFNSPSFMQFNNLYIIQYYILTPNPLKKEA